MPYISSTKKLNEQQDRRRKLSEAQKREILRLYGTGMFSQRKLANRFKVSRSTIQIIVNPKRAEAVSRRIKEHWKDYMPDKEERARITREHRRYKQELFLKGELK